MNPLLRILVLILILVLIGGAVISAEDPADTAHSQEDQGASRSVKGEHEVALFLGVTDDRGTDAFTWGFDYAYNFTNRLGAGVFVDRTEGDLRMSVFGGLLYVRPTRELAVVIGPGVERLDPLPGEGGEEGSHEGTETEFLIRAGALYGFPLSDHVTVAPALYVDYVNDEFIWVGGVDIIYRF